MQVGLKRHVFSDPLDNNKDNNENVQELSVQETQLSEMINELTNFDENHATLPMLLQHCPDSINHLLDKCIIHRRIQVVKERYHFYFH